MAPVSTSVPAAVVLKAVRGWRLFPCRTEIDRPVMAAHRPLPTGSTGSGWLMLAAEMAGLARQLAVTAGSRADGLGRPAAGRHARAQRTGRIGPCRAVLHPRHLAPVGHGAQQPGHRDRGVGDGDQRAAARPAGARRYRSPAADPTRPAAAGALGAVRGRRPGQRGSGAANPRSAGRGRSRAADDLRVQRPVGLYRAKRRGKGRVGHVHLTGRTAFPDPAPGQGRPRPGAGNSTLTTGT